MVPKERILLLPNLHWAPSKLRNQHSVPGLDAALDTAAVTVNPARTNGENLGLAELLNSSLGEEDPRGGLSLGADTLHEYAIEKRAEGGDAAESGGLRVE